MGKFNVKDKFDIIVGLSIISIVLMIIIPLPAFLLDVLLTVNISLSVLFY